MGDHAKIFKPSSLSTVTFVVLLLVFFITGLATLWLLNTGQYSAATAKFITVIGLISGFGLLLMFYLSWRQLNVFSDDINNWTKQLIQGDLSSRISAGTASPSEGIRSQINKISEDYQSLAIFEQQRSARQAERIELKKYYLEVLYDVSRTINKSKDLEDLLQRFLGTVMTVANAKAATVKLLDDKNDLKLVASIGLSEEVMVKEHTLPSPECLCAVALNDANKLIYSNVQTCAKIVETPFFDNDDADIEMLAIPLQYRDKTLGVYNLFVHRKDQVFLEGEHELLLSIGQHLGMAIEQAGVEKDAQTLSIMQERTRMAHELHDSLAQTLATLRIKIRLFDDSMRQSNNVDEHLLWQELNSLEETIDTAYAELRSLITHFRAPIDGKGVVRTIERLSERFKQQTDMDVFFYHNWELKHLNRETEIEVIRIVQEALMNVKKHSHAKGVRILMISTEEGHCSILVEDDGIGLDENKIKKKTPENHIGLSVMRERAQRINGEIQYEDDDGEGTLIQLNFEVPVNKDVVHMKHMH